MQFIRRHWYNLGIAFAAIAVAWASFGHLTTVQVILLLNFAVLSLHQFEEYGWPVVFLGSTTKFSIRGAAPPTDILSIKTMLCS